MKTNRTKLQRPIPASKPKKNNNRSTITGTFSEHIKELRRRIFWVLATFLVASSAAYQYRDPLIEVVLRPLADQPLVYLTPGGGFSFIFQVTMYAGLLVTAPLVAYHLHAFIKPALPEKSRHSALGVVGVAALLMTAGVLFGYFIAVPAALQFLAEFAGDYIQPNLTADSYLSFFLSYVAGLGLLFQLPLLLMFWHWVSPLTPGKLLNSERYIIIFAFIAAAIITPTPDVMNQAMIAAPILVIYQFGVVAVLLSIAHERRQQNREAATAPLVLAPIPVYDDPPEAQELIPYEPTTVQSAYHLDYSSQADATTPLLNPDVTVATHLVGSDSTVLSAQPELASRAISEKKTKTSCTKSRSSKSSLHLSRRHTPSLEGTRTLPKTHYRSDDNNESFMVESGI